MAERAAALAHDLTKAWAFNCQPSRWLHDDWWATLPHAELLRRAARSPRGAGRIDQWLLAHFRLAGHWVTDFSSPVARCALLPPPHLEAVVFYAGVTLNHPAIRRVVLADAVRRLRARIGAEAHDFALTRAAAVLADEQATLALPRRGDARAHLLVSGLCCLGQALAGAPAGLRGRVVLKLPRRWRGVLLHPPALLAGTDCQGLLRRLVVALGMGAALGYDEAES